MHACTAQQPSNNVHVTHPVTQRDTQETFSEIMDSVNCLVRLAYCAEECRPSSMPYFIVFGHAKTNNYWGRSGAYKHVGHGS